MPRNELKIEKIYKGISEGIVRMTGWIPRIKDFLSRRGERFHPGMILGAGGLHQH